MALNITYTNEKENTLGNCYKVFLGAAGCIGIFRTEVAAYNFVAMLNEAYDPNYTARWVIQKCFVANIGF